MGAVGCGRLSVWARWGVGVYWARWGVALGAGGVWGLSAVWRCGLGFGCGGVWAFGRGGVWALDAVALMTIWCVHGSQLRRAVID